MMASVHYIPEPLIMNGMLIEDDKLEKTKVKYVYRAEKVTFVVCENNSIIYLNKSAYMKAYTYAKKEKEI